MRSVPVDPMERAQQRITIDYPVEVTKLPSERKILKRQSKEGAG